jgi:hypothetical protein
LHEFEQAAKLATGTSAIYAYNLQWVSDQSARNKKKMCNFFQNYDWKALNDQFDEIKYPTFIIVHPGAVFHQIKQNVASIAIKHI